MGPTVDLPTSAYSDDTQLRLAVGRCVRTGGRFDIEAFSKIELPVFLSYQLGAGLGTKAAARALGRRTTRWYSNFFDDRGASYANGGGNGAAMRIHPHVWAAPRHRPDAFLPPVLRDAITTHGHPRGILGAALHALSLGTLLHEGQVPAPDRWPAMVRYLERTIADIRGDEILATRWLPEWERRADTSWDDAVMVTITELGEQLNTAAKAAGRGADRDIDTAYRKLVTQLGGMEPKTRGAGTISAVLALWLGWSYQNDPERGVRIAAGLLGSDTDTVASMAGALLGTVASAGPPDDIADADLIAGEATRLDLLSKGQRQSSFPHPDTLHWRPPSSIADSVGLIRGRVAVAGLGAAREESEPIRGSGKNAGVWQWLLTDYGQRLLVKRRPELRDLPESAMPRTRTPPARAGEASSRPIGSTIQPSLFGGEESPARQGLPTDPDAALALLARSDFDADLLKRLLENFAHEDEWRLKSALFASALVENIRRRGR
jgi:ADP-ribosylglycohydrolase